MMSRRPKPPRGVPQEAWDLVNWTNTDAEIAQQVGVSRQTINTVRRKAGIPSAHAYQRRLLVAPIERMYHGGYPLKEIGRRLGVHEETVKRIVDEYRFVRQDGTTRPRSPSRMKYPWDDVDWSLTNSEIAKQLKTTYHNAWRARKRFAPPEHQEGGLLTDGNQDTDAGAEEGREDNREGR